MTHVSYAISHTVVQSVSQVSFVERCVHLQYFPQVCVMASAVQNIVSALSEWREEFERQVHCPGGGTEKDNVLTEVGCQDPQLTRQKKLIKYLS